MDETTTEQAKTPQKYVIEGVEGPQDTLVGHAVIHIQELVAAADVEALIRVQAELLVADMTRLWASVQDKCVAFVEGK